ncbi:MAG: LTA synthase family protein [Myxococcales bacterium]|jgi:phosphoglycerol transferase MdoB-like AlkP superfamily enzyme|nr:LTA synthase family protein [Myxococcales bacterium]
MTPRESSVIAISFPLLLLLLALFVPTTQNQTFVYQPRDLSQTSRTTIPGQTGDETPGGTWTFGPYLSLEKGRAQFNLKYWADTDTNKVDYAFTKGTNSSSPKSLPVSQRSASHRISQPKGQAFDDLEVRTIYGGTGTLRVERLTIQHTAQASPVFIWILFGITLALGALYFFIRRSISNKQYILINVCFGALFIGLFCLRFWIFGLWPTLPDSAPLLTIIAVFIATILSIEGAIPLRRLVKSWLFGLCLPLLSLVLGWLLAQEKTICLDNTRGLKLGLGIALVALFLESTLATKGKAALFARLDEILPITSMPRRAIDRVAGFGLKLLSAFGLSALIVAGVEAARIYFSGASRLNPEIDTLLVKPIGITVVGLALALLAIRALVNRLSVALLVCVPLAFGLLIGHLQKQAMLGKPLALADLGLLHELWDVRAAVVAGKELQFAAIGLVLLLAVVAMGVCLFKRARWPMRWSERALVLALTVGLLGAELRFTWFVPALQSNGVKNEVWDYEHNLRHNGFFLPLFMNARQVIPRIEGYGVASVDRLFEALPPVPLQEMVASAESISPSAAAPGVRPDVILYMAEAFWDVTRLGLHFNRDPIPNFRALAASHGLLSTTSPQRSGGTGNVEFEALTGIPHGLLPISSVPYIHFLRRPLRALPALFREQGYETTALHNFYRYYYSREAAYPLLGFERFIALDELSPVGLDGERPEGNVNNRRIAKWGDIDALTDGRFPSDEPLVWRLLEELDAPRQEGDRPRFLFAISMVTHAPYLNDRWPTLDVTLSPDERSVLLSEEAAREVENYANRLLRADAALGHLIRSLEKRERPTLLVFFGDHLPGLLNETFAAMGFAPGEREHRRYETPLLFWSNRPLPGLDAMASGNASPAFSVFYLSPKILKAAGLPLPKHLELLASVEKELPSLNASLLQTSAGEWLAGPNDARASPAVTKIVEKLRLLTYDRLAGECLSERPSLELP